MATLVLLFLKKGQLFFFLPRLCHFSTTYAIVSSFFSRLFNEKFKFIKNCPYDYHKISQSFYTQRGPACTKASKLYDWDVRNIAKISPKWPKNSHFRLFSIFSKTKYTRTKFSTVVLKHIRVLYVQWHQNRIAGM